jgi:hypothetical protein
MTAPAAPLAVEALAPALPAWLGKPLRRRGISVLGLVLLLGLESELSAGDHVDSSTSLRRALLTDADRLASLWNEAEAGARAVLDGALASGGVRVLAALAAAVPGEVVRAVLLRRAAALAWELLCSLHVNSLALTASTGAGGAAADDPLLASLAAFSKGCPALEVANSLSRSFIQHGLFDILSALVLSCWDWMSVLLLYTNSIQFIIILFSLTSFFVQCELQALAAAGGAAGQRAARYVFHCTCHCHCHCLHYI